jgi:hypothetical protein
VASLTERDGLLAPDSERLLRPFAEALLAAGLERVACRAVTAADVAALDSTWAKRLGIPARRPAWLLTARRSPLAEEH